MIASLPSDLSFTDWALVLAATGYVISRIAEARGWTRSSQVLRRENEDLIRRNTDLEHTMQRQSGQIDELILKVKVLEAEMAELRKKDQTAVLERLTVVEVKADGRHNETLEVLQKIAENTGNTGAPGHVTETQVTTETKVTESTKEGTPA